jgi:hypothetical protein
MAKQELQAQLDILREVYQDINRLAHMPSTEVIHQLAESVKDELHQASTTESLSHDYTAASIDILVDTPTFPSIDSLTSQELKNALDSLPELLNWINKLKAHAIAELMNNNESFGYKLRKGANRASFKTNDLSELANKANVPLDSMYEQKPISASKFLKGLSDEQRLLVADYIDTKYNEPSLIKRRSQADI